MAGIERALGAAGVEITTLTSDHGLIRKPGREFATADGAARVYSHLWMLGYKIAPGMVLYLARNINRFDVVHIHALFCFSSTVAAWIARMSGVPYVIRPLGTLATYGMQNRRRLLKRLSLAFVEGPNLAAAAAVHFTSVAEMDQARALGLAFREVVIPLGTEIDPMEAVADLSVEYPALEGRRVVLFLSRLDPKKNVEVLIDAFATSQELRSSATLLIAGDGDPSYITSLKARVRAAELHERVVWLGQVAGARKAAAFRAADVFVLPSFSENFGIAAVEAMLAGLPCVLTSNVAIAIDATEAKAAMLAEPTASAVARAIVELLDQGGKNGPMGPLARAHALARYSPQAMVARLIELYNEVSSSRVKNPL